MGGNSAGADPDLVGFAKSRILGSNRHLNGNAPAGGYRSTVLGVSSLAEGVATLSTALLPAGIRILHCHYGGNSDYTASDSGALSEFVIANPGSGLQAAVYYPTSYNGGPWSVGIGDFNGDGRPDLAIPNFMYPGFGSNTVTIMLNNGDGTFRSGQVYTAGIWPKDVAVGDFNGDGKADLLVMGIPNGTTSAILLGNGDGTFQANGQYLVGGTSVAIADFNGDGNADALIVGAQPSGAGAGGSFALQLGNGDGTFRAPVYHSSSPGQITVGDFNSDGKEDIAITCCGGGMAVQLGNGDGTFQPYTLYSSSEGGYGIVAGDFNADGKLDLAVANGDSIVVYLGHGDGSFQSPLISYVGGLTESLAVGDFNSDGRTFQPHRSGSDQRHSDRDRDGAIGFDAGVHGWVGVDLSH